MIGYNRSEDTPSSNYGSDEEEVSSTPIGLGAAPSTFDRLTPSPSQSQIIRTTVALHGSSLGAGGMSVYNINSPTTATSSYPLSGLTTTSSIINSISPPNGLVTSSGLLPKNGSPSPTNNVRNTVLSMDYHTTIEKAKMNGIVPEIIRGGEIIYNNDGKKWNKNA